MYRNSPQYNDSDLNFIVTNYQLLNNHNNNSLENKTIQENQAENDQ